MAKSVHNVIKFWIDINKVFNYVWTLDPDFSNTQTVAIIELKETRLRDI